MRNRSLIRLISSMLIFGTISVFRRFLPVSSSFLACFRGITGSLILLLFLHLRGKHLDHACLKRHLVKLMVSGGIIGFNWILLFESYRYTTVAVSTLCYYMAPTLVMLASPLVLKTHLTPRRILCILLSFAGMLCISGLGSESTSQSTAFLGVLLGLGAAVLYASVVLINSFLHEVPSIDRTIIQLLAAGIVVAPYTALTGGFALPSLQMGDWLLLLLLAFVHTALAYLLYFSSMTHLSTQTIALLSYLDPVTAVLLSAFFLHEPMGILSIIGTVLILTAAVLGELPEKASGPMEEE
ncbi:MAG: EamA family transporter [Clostridia bacterium]|nr:EamA family transporter [Clostridia bacterium]